MDCRGDESNHTIFLGEFENNKRYKDSIVKEIIAAICAMMNSNGGRGVISFDTDSNVPVDGFPFSHFSLIIRILEQNMISIIGSNQTVSKIDFKEGEECIVIFIKKSDSLIVTNYHLYLPSESQVVQILPREPPERVKNDIINRNFVSDPVQLGSHCKNFQRNKDCGFRESKKVQLKNVKANSAKRTRLADRITSKSNKFTCYVCAFANHCGGHMYYGIKDDGIVEGEEIPDEDMSEIIRKIEKAIKKVIWPETIDQPTQGVHWDMFFEPVLDENSNAIPSTFVIVIYVAACLGGVFTEESEIYKMVDGKVKKMSFIESIPHSTGGNITWSSKATQSLCIQIFCDLTVCLNNGNWKEFERMSRHMEDKHPDIVEVKLVVLLKRILARSRQHNFITADGLLQEYNKLRETSKERHIFEVLGLYVRAAHTRPKGKEGDSLNHIRDLLVAAMAKSEWLFPGLVTALVYLFAGTMTDRFQDMFLYAPDVLSHNALQHLQRIGLDHEVCTDLKYKAHITLATSYLGCNLSGEVVADRVDDRCLDQAAFNISTIHESVRKSNKHKLTHYREVQVKLVESILLYRRSQNQPSDRMKFMKEAFEFSREGEKLARKWKFYEMETWSRSLQTFFIVKLLYCVTFSFPVDLNEYDFLATRPT